MKHICGNSSVVAHLHPVRVIRFSPPLAAHRAVQVALALSLLQARLCLIRVRVLVSHHPAVVPAHLAHLRSHPVPRAFHHPVAVLRALAVLHLVPLHSPQARRPVIQHFLQALVVLHSQALQAVRRLSVAVHRPSHLALQALHPVTRLSRPLHALALALHLRARVLMNYKASISIQTAKRAALRYRLWDLEQASLIE